VRVLAPIEEIRKEGKSKMRPFNACVAVATLCGLAGLSQAATVDLRPGGVTSGVINGATFLRGDLRSAGTGVIASFFADALAPRLLYGATGVAPSLHRSARNVIFVFLSGGPSQTDLWDLKEGAWTPLDFAPTSYGDIRWPQGLLPKTAEHLSKITIARCGLAWAAVHQLGQSDIPPHVVGVHDDPDPWGGELLGEVDGLSQ